MFGYDGVSAGSLVRDFCFGGFARLESEVLLVFFLILMPRREN